MIGPKKPFRREQLSSALTPGPSPNHWARGDRIGPLVGTPSPSFWERGPGGEQGHSVFAQADLECVELAPAFLALPR